jgi:hypothetical protein
MNVCLLPLHTPNQPFHFRPASDIQLCAHHGHPAEPSERSELDIQASAPSDGETVQNVGVLRSAWWGNRGAG